MNASNSRLAAALLAAAVVSGEDLLRRFHAGARPEPESLVGRWSLVLQTDSRAPAGPRGFFGHMDIGRGPDEVTVTGGGRVVKVRGRLNVGALECAVESAELVCARRVPAGLWIEDGRFKSVQPAHHKLYLFERAD